MSPPQHKKIVNTYTRVSSSVCFHVVSRIKKPAVSYTCFSGKKRRFNSVFYVGRHVYDKIRRELACL